MLYQKLREGRGGKWLVTDGDNWRGQEEEIGLRVNDEILKDN